MSVYELIDSGFELYKSPIQQITLMHMKKSEWIFKKIEFTDITKSYYKLNIVKTHRALASFSDHKELNKSNTFKNALTLIHS